VRLQGSAARLTIIVDANDGWHHRPLYTEIISRAHHEGLAGATALRGVSGYGDADDDQTGEHHTRNKHHPVMIIIVDDHTRIHTFLYSLDDILTKGVVLIDDVEVVRYHADSRHRRGR
jgi:hypothetical protein